MFPFEEEVIEETEDLEEEESYPMEYEIDFQTGQLTGNVVEGVRAIAVWCWMALLTQRYRYFIYSWEYGSELESLIGKNCSNEYLDSELKRMIEECIMVNKYVEEIKNLTYSKEKSTLKVNFTIVTILGEEAVEIYV